MTTETNQTSLVEATRVKLAALREKWSSCAKGRAVPTAAHAFLEIAKDLEGATDLVLARDLALVGATAAAEFHEDRIGGTIATPDLPGPRGKRLGQPAGPEEIVRARLDELLVGIAKVRERRAPRSVCPRTGFYGPRDCSHATKVASAIVRFADALPLEVGSDPLDAKGELVRELVHFLACVFGSAMGL